MALAVPLVLGGFAILIIIAVTWLGGRKHQRVTAATLPVTAADDAPGPRILVHDINDDRCTGCDACVAVCPTNVLDLVANKSRVLRFEDCIQCEACMVACPTEALVMYPKGTRPPSLKVPELDASFQTVVPGQYLIGEVAGKPLIKNAANLGRAVVEHMLATGLRPGRSSAFVDVVIVGSGPGGLSAALSCIQHGLSYVVLEKEPMIASTIARYPRGKLVMAEPYDAVNLSLLPVFDGSKELLISVWKELFARVGLVVRTAESVETVARTADGMFEIATTIARHRAQRVVLAIGTRGKPRTLGVPGEHLPKLRSMLDDPQECTGHPVLVVGGGDSACEAAFALADAGARVTVSYRGAGFHRAGPKNKATMERYVGEGRVRALLGSQIVRFDPQTVDIAHADGAHRRHPNAAAFVLIGADPPVEWLGKLGIRSVERPHQYAHGKTDELVRRFVRALECPDDAARAAAQLLGYPVAPVAVPAAPAPRKWMQSATSLFRKGTSPGVGSRVVAEGTPPPSQPRKRFGPNAATVVVHHTHSGSGRRDDLSTGERARVLRMLRDDGARLADQDEPVHVGAAPTPDG